VEGEEAEGNEAAVVREGGGGGGRGRQQVSEHGGRDEGGEGEVSVGGAAEKGKRALWAAFVARHDVGQCAEGRRRTSDKGSVLLHLVVLLYLLCLEVGK
jgi:hypothetical protein